MDVMMFRARIKPEHVAEVDAAVAAIFAELNDARPDGIRYASTKAEDGQTFVILLALEGENPLPQLPAYQRFQEQLPAWLAERPTPETLTVVGSYGLF